MRAVDVKNSLRKRRRELGFVSQPWGSIFIFRMFWNPTYCFEKSSSSDSIVVLSEPVALVARVRAKPIIY